MRGEKEFSSFNFDAADTGILTNHFSDSETECSRLLAKGLTLPAYDHCIKASHVFNVLDARGVISVAERQAYIGRVRSMVKGCCELFLDKEVK